MKFVMAALHAVCRPNLISLKIVSIRVVLKLRQYMNLIKGEDEPSYLLTYFHEIRCANFVKIIAVTAILC